MDVVHLPQLVEVEAGIVQVALRATGAHRGDLVAVMTHVERAEIFAWLTKNRFKPVTVERVRQIVLKS
jgi:hypothetical protein